jgi:hypothetical protein
MISEKDDTRPTLIPSHFKNDHALPQSMKNKTWNSSLELPPSPLLSLQELWTTVSELHSSIREIKKLISPTCRAWALEAYCKVGSGLTYLKKCLTFDSLLQFPPSDMRNSEWCSWLKAKYLLLSHYRTCDQPPYIFQINLPLRLLLIVFFVMCEGQESPISSSSSSPPPPTRPLPCRFQ